MNNARHDTDRTPQMAGDALRLTVIMPKVEDLVKSIASEAEEIIGGMAKKFLS